MQNKNFNTIKNSATAIFRDRNSKFIGVASHLSSIDQLDFFLKDLKKQYHDAQHFCYAYIIGDENIVWKVNDDGEPSGSAGLPIYNQCLSNNLTNVIVAVVRYFGGTKLGIQGLINAYKTTAKLTIENAEVIPYVRINKLKVFFEYGDLNSVMSFVKKNNYKILNQIVDIKCQIDIIIPVKQRKSIEDFFSEKACVLEWEE